MGGYIDGLSGHEVGDDTVGSRPRRQSIAGE